MPQYQQSQQGVQDRTVPVSRDLIYTAMKQYPGYDQQTALALYLIDQNAQQQQTDAEQTQLIQTQQQQNNKLTNAVKTIGKELYDFEQQSAETDKEVERLNALIAKLKPGAGATAQAAKTGSEEVAKVQAELSKLKLAGQEELKNLDDQLKDIKNKPNIDKEKYEQLVKDIDAIKNLKSLESPDVQKIEAALAQLQSSRGDDQSLFNKIQNELEKTKQSLIEKEKRFRSYIKRTGKETEERTKSSAAELQKYADIVAGYKNEIDSLKNDLQTAQQAKNEIDSLKNDLQTAQQAKDDILAIRSEFADELKTIKRSVARLRMNKEIPAEISDVTPAAVDAATSTINRAKARASDLTSLGGEYQKQADWSQSYAQQAYQAPGYASGDLFTDQDEEKDRLSENVRPSKNYADKEYGFWITKNLPVITQMFKNKFWDELSRKDPKYPDAQIAYTIEEYAPWLWNHESPSLTKQIMDEFLDGVFDDLFEQPPEHEQAEFDFREGLDRIYESMLDQIITKTLSKSR